MNLPIVANTHRLKPLITMAAPIIYKVQYEIAKEVNSSGILTLVDKGLDYLAGKIADHIVQKEKQQMENK